MKDTTKEKEDCRIARGVINQIFDYLIENGIKTSVEFRQKHNDRLADYVTEVYDKELDRAREEWKREVIEDLLNKAKYMAKDYFSGETKVYIDKDILEEELSKLTTK